MRALAISLLLVAVLDGATQPASCSDCVDAQYWAIDPAFWKSAAPDLGAFPERQLPTPLGGADLGVAFSGGGTRSASAAIGQLRGLDRNGWLTKVRYMTAVSGGSWAAVPFTYYGGAKLSDLLGQYHAPNTLVVKTLTEIPNGALARQVTRSGLAASGLEEVPPFLPDVIRGRDVKRWRDLLVNVRDMVRKVRRRDLPDPTRQNKTYAHMLGQIFIDPLVPGGNRRPYTWTRDSGIALTEVSGQGQMDFQQVPPDRPFLIVGGTIVWMHPGFAYPRLIPVEYTPLYTGVRQQFGNLGGTYVMPWAYDRSRVEAAAGTLLRVDGSAVRMFTLADVIASSGAAPQLQLLLGTGLPAKLKETLRTAGGTFPAFRPLAVREGKPVAVEGEMAHGDGGFTDNLGIMPLLARQVHHIIAFVNSNKVYGANEQLQSYFFPLAVRDGNGDKSMNAVFPKEAYRALLEGLDRVTAANGGPAVFCQTLDVAANEIYNIGAYKGLKICWVYNFAAASWVSGMPSEVQTWLKPPKEGGAKALRHFPYYATFEENKPYLIKMNTLQVNLLADLACWSITNPVSRSRVSDYFGDALLSSE